MARELHSRSASTCLITAGDKTGRTCEIALRQEEREREWHKSDKSRAFIALCGRCRGVSLNNGLETLVKIFFNESGSLGETPTKVTIKFFGPQWRPWKGSRTLCPFGSCRQSRLSIIDKWKQWLLPAPVINGLPFWGCFNYICSPGLPPPPPQTAKVLWV